LRGFHASTSGRDPPRKLPVQIPPSSPIASSNKGGPMNRSRLALLTLAAILLFCLLGLGIAAAEKPDAGQGLTDARQQADNGQTVFRCGTVDRGKPKTSPDFDQIQRWITENRVQAGGVIPVHFHVIYSGSTGNIPQSQIDAQILVLNRNYAGQDYNGNPVTGARNTGYTFVPAILCAIRRLRPRRLPAVRPARTHALPRGSIRSTTTWITRRTFVTTTSPPGRTRAPTS